VVNTRTTGWVIQKIVTFLASYLSTLQGLNYKGRHKVNYHQMTLMGNITTVISFAPVDEHQ
jgi:hypothetical protein